MAESVPLELEVSPPITAMVGADRMTGRLSQVLPSRIVMGVGLGIAVGYANTAASSWIEHALKRDLGLTIGQASYIVSAELLTMGLAMTFLADFASRLPRKTAYFIALSLMLIVQVVSAATKGFWPLISVRSLSGILFGMLYTLAILSGTDTGDAQKTFAGASAIALVVGTFFGPFIGFGSAHFGISGVFLGLGVYCALFCVPILFLPLKRKSNFSASAEPIDESPIDRKGAIAVLIIMALMTISSGCVTLFTVILAEQVGLHGSKLGFGLAVVSLVSTTGSIIASIIGTRFGNFPPIAIGLMLLAMTLAFFTGVTHQFTFWMGITLLVALFWFLSPYVFGLSALVDKQGRLASATGGTKILFGAVGAALGGFIENSFGLHAVGFVAFGICVAAIPVSAFLCVKMRPNA